MIDRRVVWILVAFDLPVGTKDERKRATKFRLFLLDNGFEMAQFSVYLRYCASKSEADKHTKRLIQQVPERGKIDVLCFTDKQYENIVSYDANARKIRKNPSQYALF